MTASSRDRRKAQAKRAGSADRTRTLGEWWAHYENELRSRDCRPATVRQYRKVLDRLGRFIGDDAHAAEVTAETLEDWRDVLVNEGLSPYTVKLYLRQVGPYDHWLVDEGVIADSPALPVAYVKQRNREATPPVFDAAQVKALVSTAAKGRSGKVALRPSATRRCCRSWRTRASGPPSA
jgi:site-specific recombinase XerD